MFIFQKFVSRSSVYSIVQRFTKNILICYVPKYLYYQLNMTDKKEILNAPMTVLGMVNGMIGGLILLLPVYTLQAGYLLSLIVILFTGLFSFYSCYLCIIHMGDQPDLDYAILRHFNGARWPKIFYDFCVWSCLVLIDLLYFELIIFQWQGLIPPHEFSFINPLVNAFVLFGLVFLLKYLELGASIMSYGIISIISYLIFLIWVIATYQQGNDSVDYKAFGDGAVNLAAAMGGAFSIQSFFIPVLKKNPKSEKYVFYTMLAYILGSAAYLYIAYMGSVGIWKRSYHGDKGNQPTIEGYFGQNTWEVNIIQGIYLIHLYSVYPEFMLVGKKRFFSIFQLKESERGNIKITEIIYFAIMVGVCFLAGYFKVNIDDFIDINGAVFGFFFIYSIPATLHIKCLYFSKGKRPLPAPQIEQQTPKQTSSPLSIREVELSRASQPSEKLPQPQKAQLGTSLLQSGQSKVQASKDASSKLFLSQSQTKDDYYYCNCHLSSYSRNQLILDWIAIIIMIALGVFIMVNGIITVIHN